MRRIMCVLAVGILAGLLVLPAWGQEQEMRLSLTWDAPTTMEPAEPGGPAVPIPEGLLIHYIVYMCESPIEAGGPNADNPMIEPVTCADTLQMQEVAKTGVEAQFTVKKETGTMHFRVSAVGSNGLQSRLSDELEVKFHKGQIGKPGKPQQM